MKIDEFYELLAKENIILTDIQKEQLSIYAKELLEYNKKTNLTALKTIPDVYLKHFYDSLTLVKAYQFTNETVLDIGTGAGFPGLVLKIVFPNLKITLLDSNHHKTDFLKYIVSILKITDVAIINDRAEEYFKTNKKYDIVVARAVSNLNILSELGIPFCNLNGSFLVMKGNCQDEIINSQKAINILGGTIIKEINFKLPIELSERTIIVIKKEKATPKKYPRLYQQILKNPLQ
jgi:16S rRNA (guanine527-N7)-methyltransferase